MSHDPGESDRSEVRDDFVEYLRQNGIDDWFDLRPESSRQATIDWIEEKCGYEYSSRPQTTAVSGPLPPPTSADRAKLRDSSLVSREDLIEHNSLMVNENCSFYRYVIRPDRKPEYIVAQFRVCLGLDVEEAQQPDILSASDIDLYCKNLELSAWLSMLAKLCSNFERAEQLFAPEDHCHRLMYLSKLLKPKDHGDDDTISFDGDAMKQAFHVPYRDPANQVDRVLQHIYEYSGDWARGENKNRKLGPYTSLVQSSMFGKSRLLRQMSKKVPLIYMNLRLEKGRPKHDYYLEHDFPVGHTRLGQYFDEMMEGTEYRRVRAIRMLLSEAIIEYSRFLSRHEMIETSSGEFVFPMFLFDHLSENTEFWNLVLRKIEAGNERQDYESDLRKKWIVSLRNIHERTSTKYRGLVLLAVDEASRLFPTPGDEPSTKVTLFRTFRKVLAEMFVGYRFFTIVTDTFGKVADFLPRTSSISASAQAIEKSGSPAFYPPICLVNTMHIFARDFFLEFSRSKIIDSGRLISFGRPAFHNLYQQRENRHHLIRLAVEKLSRQEDFSPDHLSKVFRGSEKAVSVEAIAVLSILLAMCPSAHSQYSADIVAR